MQTWTLPQQEDCLSNWEQSMVRLQALALGSDVPLARQSEEEEPFEKHRDSEVQYPLSNPRQRESSPLVTKTIGFKHRNYNANCYWPTATVRTLWTMLGSKTSRSIWRGMSQWVGQWVGGRCSSAKLDWKQLCILCQAAKKIAVVVNSSRNADWKWAER